MKLIIAFIIASFVSGCTREAYVSPYVEICGIVKTVGGCSKDGLCGVMFENGHQDSTHFPVVGGRSCYWIKKDGAK